MNVKFKVLKEDVLLRVKSEAYLIGESNKQGNSVDIERATKMQASDDDDYILGEYIASAASTVVDLLTGHLSTARLDTEAKRTETGINTLEYIFDCELPSTYDVNQNTSIEEGIRQYMAEYALLRWTKRVAPGLADKSELEQIMSNINHRINQRTRPVRRNVLPLNF